MKKKLIGLLMFGGATVLAAALYWLTLPDGLPWGVDTAVAGRHALPLCALAAGCVGAVANRYFGWKIGAAAAIAWTFFPRVWDGAILGERMAAYAALAAVALWALNALMLFVFRKAIAVHHTASEQGQGTLSDAGVRDWRMWLNYLSGWAFLGAAVIFAVASLWLHDYQLGEPASVYARGAVEAAGGRIVVLNGVCDEQVEEQVEGCRLKVEETAKGSGQGQERVFATISFWKGDEYREKIVAWAKREWPDETNIWVAAHVGVEAFLDVATKAHPERFYSMNGDDTTPEQWERRWEEYKPYLKSSDKFVPFGRRLFGYEGNGVANRMQEEGQVKERGEGEQGNGSDSSVSPQPQPAAAKAAWQMYKRIYEEVDPGNAAALVNMGEMIRRGYKATERDEANVKKSLEALLSNKRNRQHLREIVKAAGPVRIDPETLAKMAEERQKRIAAAKAAGEKLELTAEAKELFEQNNAMVEAAEKGDLETAGKIARKILEQPKWRGFIPANAVMGDVSAKAGDHAAAERFYRAATSGTNATPAVVWNNYADTLMQLGKFDEAEKILRKCIAETDEKFWPPRFTLAEVLTRKVKSKSEKGKGEDVSVVEKEVRELVASVTKNAPAEMIRSLREKQRKGEILK